MPPLGYSRIVVLFSTHFSKEIIILCKHIGHMFNIPYEYVHIFRSMVGDWYGAWSDHIREKHILAHVGANWKNKTKVSEIQNQYDYLYERVVI